MKLPLFSSLACVLAATLFATSAPAADAPAPAAFPQPDVAFFTKLRMDFAKRPDFNGMWKLDDEREAVFAAAKAKDYAKVVTLSKAWLDKCPVDAEMHYVRAQALVIQGDISHYAYDLYYYYGLIQSIASGGDGKSDKTAFKVISVDEEYSLLNDFGAKLVQQSLVGHCDVMKCKLPDGKEIDYYFDATIPLENEAKMLNPKK